MGYDFGTGSYNSSVIRSTGKSPFHIVYGQNHKGIVYLFDLPEGAGVRK